MNQQKYIILTGGDGGYGNLGDEFILAAVKEFYRAFLSNYSVIILQINPPTTPSDGFIYAKDDHTGFKALQINLDDIVLVHFYGGGYLNHYWYEDKIWLLRYLMERGFPLSKVSFSGQGLGPFYPEQELNFRRLTSGINAIGVRDHAWESRIPNAVFSFDESIRLISPFFSLLRSNLTTKRNLVTINVRQADHIGIDDKIFLEVIRMILSAAAFHRLKPIFYGMIENKYLNESLHLRQLLGTLDESSHTVMPRPRDYRELLRIMRYSALNVTTSYHASLASLYSYVPTVSLYLNDFYADKFKGLEAIFTSPHYRSLKIDCFSHDTIETALRQPSLLTQWAHYRILRMLKQRNQAFYNGFRRFLA
jgi:polysaccharide pyruvyl transferase WcaK-like protein